MMHGRNTYLAPSLIGSLPFLQSTEYNPCITHLKLEAQLVSVFGPILHEVSLAEVEVIEDVPDIQRLLDQWSPMMGRFESLLPKLKDPHGELPRQLAADSWYRPPSVSCSVRLTEA